MGAPNPWALLGAPEEARAWFEVATIAFIPFPSLIRSKGSKGSSDKALIVADPTSNLPRARDEARRVARHFQAPKLLEGPDAKRGAVLAALKDADYVHFAGHGVLDVESPWNSHLQLAEGERFTLEDVFAGGANARRVVLSGCETGVGVAISKTVRLSLPEAFVAAGAETVLATTRTVTDAEALAFVERFYEAGGATEPALAFRTAVLRSDDSLWTAFYLLAVRQ